VIFPLMNFLRLVLLERIVPKRLRQTHRGLA